MVLESRLLGRPLDSGSIADILSKKKKCGLQSTGSRSGPKNKGSGPLTTRRIEVFIRISQFVNVHRPSNKSYIFLEISMFCKKQSLSVVMQTI